jgi:hypothetical protein
MVALIRDDDEKVVSLRDFERERAGGVVHRLPFALEIAARAAMTSLSFSALHEGG